jgi:hypothetical protein
MRFQQRVTYLVFAGAIGGAVTAATLAQADTANNPPTAAQIAFAQKTSDLMTNTMFAALVQEITETTPDNAANGTQSITLIFDGNPWMKLVGTDQPLNPNDVPSDSFEQAALAAALNGQGDTSVEIDNGKWFYRRSNPLSTFVPQCAICHQNFSAYPANTFVGALMEKIPINTGN